jgi:mRNA interferase MazF
MPTFDPFDVVAVPFPYVERNARQRRPAVVIAEPDIQMRYALAWVLMVTSTANARWPDDVVIHDLAAAGLRSGSMVRPVKIATVETARCDRLGRLDHATTRSVAAVLRRIVAAAAAL